MLWPKQRGPKPIETGHPAGRVNDVGQAWESKSEAANDAREAVKTGRAMSPNGACRAGLDRGLNGLKAIADDLRLGTYSCRKRDQQGFPV